MENYVRNERMFLPENLRYYARSLAFTRNTQKIDPVNSTSSAPNSTTIINLPSNALVNPSISLHATFTVGANGALPAHTSSLIHRLEVLLNGVPIQEISEYGVLYNLVANATMNQSKILGDFVGMNTVAETAGAVAYDGVIPIWLGFLGSADPLFLDTGVIGEIQIRCTWSPNSVLGNQAGEAYQIDNISAFCDVVELGDNGLYRSLVAGRLMEGGSIEIPFKNYDSFQQARGGTAGSLRGSVVGQSLDKIIITTRAQITDSGAIAVGLTPFQTFAQDSLTQAYFTIDNIRYPQFTTENTHQQLQQTRKCWGHMDDPDGGDFLTAVCTAGAPETIGKPTQASFRDRRFQYAVRLNDDDSDRLASGYSTRGMNSPVVFHYNGTGGTATNTVFMFVEKTSKLVVMAGQVSQVVL